MKVVFNFNFKSTLHSFFLVITSIINPASDCNMTNEIAMPSIKTGNDRYLTISNLISKIKPERTLTQLRNETHRYSTCRWDQMDISEEERGRKTRQMKKRKVFLHNFPSLNNQVGCNCRIRRLHFCNRVRFPYRNECLEYDTKPSDGDVPVLELWGMWSIPS